MARMNYDNTTLVQRGEAIPSTVPSRDKCDTSVEFCGVKLSIPLIASPMHDVCNGDMAFRLRRLGTLGIIHKFQSVEEQVKEFAYAISTPETASFEGQYDEGGVGCAIGIHDYKERFAALYNVGCRIFCIDTANGCNQQIELPIKHLQQSPDKVWIIAGNVATRQGFEYLANLKVDAIRVGIAGGSVCETKTETGVYMPVLESVDEAYRWYPTDERPLIIADGGIRIPADMNKAVAVGADLVMCGSVLAGTKEAPGEVFNEDGVLYKLYRGSASFGVQKLANGEEPDYIEGREIRVKYKGTVDKVIKRFRRGLKSSMSYMNSLNISQYRRNVSVEML